MTQTLGVFVQTQLILDNKLQDAAAGRTFDRLHPLTGAPW